MIRRSLALPKLPDITFDEVPTLQEPTRDNQNKRYGLYLMKQTRNKFCNIMVRIIWFMTRHYRTD